MNRHAIATVLVAALVLLAGCSAGTTGPGGGVTTDGTAATTQSSGSGGGTVNLYISDERNDIDDFEHLNVTVTRVGLQPAGEDGETDESVSENDSEDAGADDTDGADEWIEYEVDNRTVDLTRLGGANATKLSSFDVPNGTYEKVFVYVSEVGGTLKDGSSQRVKLPSGKLHLDSAFTVGSGEEVDFVFDITAIKAGQSGRYVLKPVISGSGTDVEIDPVDGDDDNGDDDDGDDGDERDEEAEDRSDDGDSLDASFVGDVTRGENATLSVTRNGSAVANASVTVNDEDVGTTDADGRITFPVPGDADELEVTVTKDGLEGEVEVEFDDESGSESEQDESSGDQTAAA